jgi:hypothetical protein
MTLLSTLLSNDSTDIITVAQGQQYAVTSMFFCNTSNVECLLQVWLVSGNSSPTNQNKIIHNLLIAPGDTFTFDTEKIILDSLDFIEAGASPDGSVSATISYVRVA